ncbi:hypothetical protein PV387_26560 [Streptomyces sp. ME02-6987-2C]|uniref:hypothetical protein n=1 Tax=Streptomyces sp. LRa12 TaxID=2563107 RepID=UPI00109E3888|nr:MULTISPECIES: hypothetical protein [Streptomyces]MDX3369548.1 hypothetical protein [Streptomyces sp. ME02-6987-2C]MDX3419238.1 hypothetical protein [Streptomyces sp. ME02-6985-2c]THB00287.1 hypothetical protein E6R61_00830 [Streptomyces sp. LRa12]
MRTTGGAGVETVAIRSRETGLPTDGMWDAGPVEVALPVLAAWKVPDGEVKRLTERAAVTAGSYGANYEQLGAVWGITRQGAREKWPDAVSRPAFVTAGRSTVALFGGTAELVRSSFGGSSWTGRGADGASGAAADGAPYAAAEEVAAHAGVFLEGHARSVGDQS